MKKIKKALPLILALLMIVSLFAGCGGGDSQSSGDDQAPSFKGKDMNTEEIKIAVIPLSMLGALTIPIGRAIEETMVQFPNVKIDQFECQYDATKQISVMDEVIAQGYDAIILETADPAALANSVKAAEDAGIPVITNNVNCQALHTAHVQMSDYQAGQSAAENVKKICGDSGTVVILDGPAAQTTVRRMGTGFEDYITNNSNMEIIEVQNIDNWNQEIASTTMRDVLTKHDDITAVYAANDDMALGVLQAITASGRDNDGIVVWGYVGTEAGLAAIKEGTLAGTNYLDTYQLFIAQLSTALYCISTGQNSVNMGYEETPIITLSCPAITKDNVDTYISINRYSK